MRGKPVDFGGPRGATPQLTVAKHQLRDWGESRLKGRPFDADETELGMRLNGELRNAGLFCDRSGPGQQPCPDWSLLGFINPVKLKRSGGFLILQTGVGIECGYDESAYVYGWSDEGWTRVWQNEQNHYTEKDYKPQTLFKVLISPGNATNDYLVLTLGSQSWCQSNLHDVYYRAFRMGPNPQARPLVEGIEPALIDGYPPIHGRVTANDVLVEISKLGGLGGGEGYEAVRHYRIEHDRVSRIDPFALRPREFVDEWLTRDWREVALWSEAANRGQMLDWHEKLHEGNDGAGIPGQRIYPTMHCPAMPDLWQVGVDFSQPPTPWNKPPVGTYFLVRWRPPYRFTMVGVSDRASPDCTEKDRRADDEFQTLFPGEQ